MFDISSEIRARRAGLHLERGLALSQLGRDGEARAAFFQALEDIGAERFWGKELYRRMAGLREQHAVALWEDVLKSAK